MNDEYMAELKKSNEISEETNRLLKENNDLLKQLYAFWTKIVSEEYFNEMLESYNKFPG